MIQKLSFLLVLGIILVGVMPVSGESARSGSPLFDSLDSQSGTGSADLQSVTGEDILSFFLALIGAFLQILGINTS